MERADLHRAGLRLRTKTTNAEMLAYIDGTLPLLLGQAECPRCTERRRLKALAMKRYRRKQGSDGDFE